MFGYICHPECFCACSATTSARNMGCKRGLVLMLEVCLAAGKLVWTDVTTFTVKMSKKAKQVRSFLQFGP